MTFLDLFSLKWDVPIKFRRTPATLYLTLLVVSSFLLCAALLYQLTRPNFGQGTIEYPEQPAKEFVYPFLMHKASKSRFILKENVELSYLHPTTFVFYPQDVIWAIKANGHSVKAIGLPLSTAHHEGHSINLAPFLHPGKNEIDLDMEVFWGEASLNIFTSPWDKYSLILSILILGAALATGVFFCCFLSLQISLAEIVILLGGFLLRYLYVLGTPYFVRSYDWWGHAAYLDFVSQHLTRPDSHANWEAFQPPFYYFLVGVPTKLMLFFGMAEEQRYVLWQMFSLLCSTGILMAGLWISRVLFENEIKNRLYLLAVLSVAPALVFNASRVSNDVLLNLLDFLWLGLLLQFCRHPGMRAWLGLSLILGLALLTKANALVLVPISILCLILIPDYKTKTKVLAGLVLGVISFGIAGWYYLPRAFHEGGVGNYVVGNLSDLNPKAHIDKIFAKSIVFNPFKVIRYPFVEPWGPHHEYFLEVFFKTIFLGEWIKGGSYRWLARIFVSLALLLIPVFIFGTYRSIKKGNRHALPLFITFAGVFSAHWCFVQLAPFISSQDFRYSVILLIPMVYFFIQGASDLSTRWGEASRLILQLVILNCAIYLLKLALEG